MAQKDILHIFLPLISTHEIRNASQNSKQKFQCRKKYFLTNGHVATRTAGKSLKATKKETKAADALSGTTTVLMWKPIFIGTLLIQYHHNNPYYTLLQ